MAKDCKFFIDASSVGSGLFCTRVFCEVIDGELSMRTHQGEPVYFSYLSDSEQDEILTLMCIPLEDLAWERHKIIAREYSEWRKRVGA